MSRRADSQIIDVQLERLRSMLGERGVTLALDDSARALLAREGYDPNYGARPLKRAIQTLIQNPLAVRLLRGEILPGQTIHVSADGDQMKFATEAAGQSHKTMNHKSRMRKTVSGVSSFISARSAFIRQEVMMDTALGPLRDLVVRKSA